MEDYYIISLKVTETLLYWGYSIEDEILIDREDAVCIADIIQ